MSNAPTTFRGEPGGKPHIEWDDSAALHRGDDDGILSELKAVRHGTLAELVRYVAALPEHDRKGYSIQKAGDRRLGLAEIMGLSRRPDFPKGT